MHPISLKEAVIRLRKEGNTYGQIRSKLGVKVPKSTLSGWCNGILLSQLEKTRIDEVMQEAGTRGLAMARIANRIKREKYLNDIERRVLPLGAMLREKDVQKIVLAMLYLGEGSKGIHRGSMKFGNSDARIIRLFLALLRSCYVVNESKLRITVQCRSDQNIPELERFWSKETLIPLSQFYKSRIDPRSIGKPSLKVDYKGVCVIDYFSAETFHELTKIAEVICRSGLW